MILENLSRLPGLASFGDTIEAIRAAYDVDHVYYYAISMGLQARSREDRNIVLPEAQGELRFSGRQLAAMSYSPDWLDRYLEARFADIDPVLAGATASFDPVDWADLDWSTAGRQAFRGEAEDFGIGNQGYTVPVRGPSGQFAIFTVNKACSRETWDRLLAESRTDFLLLAHFTHQRVLALSGCEDAAPPRPLSARERDALRLIAAGLGRAQAAERLGISENTLRVYIDSARYKIGALNVQHAIALAAHRGIIPPG